MDLDSIKEDVENFVKYHLNEYHHENTMSASEGEKICQLMINFLNYTKSLEKRIEELEK